jgi:NADP-dependent 3-hydroxy acid dehydrogenase YdfG
MGFFFNTPKPRVTTIEWKKVRASLFGRGFEKKEIDWVEGLFQGSLHELNIKDAGIQGDEIAQTIAWLRANPTKHRLNDTKITLLEGALRMRL